MSGPVERAQRIQALRDAYADVQRLVADPPDDLFEELVQSLVDDLPNGIGRNDV
jgi:hypothetical protein